MWVVGGGVGDEGGGAQGRAARDAHGRCENGKASWQSWGLIGDGGFICDWICGSVERESPEWRVMAIDGLRLLPLSHSPFHISANHVTFMLPSTDSNSRWRHWWIYWECSCLPTVVCCSSRDELDAVYSAVSNLPYISFSSLYSDLVEAREHEFWRIFGKPQSVGIKTSLLNQEMIVKLEKMSRSLV
ncbi:hypothetical protein LWI28_016868 [Acer negundo]|uniref:Uncharacterized protein n=1 Tax=Acer negundo TaxID=4023 RepID=A0AAD5JQJ5_ACENE|nr:hypothetical protein LWI28_016868 [Acer negundo]